METQTTDLAQGKSVVDQYAEGLRYFMGEGSLNNTLAQVTGDLKEHGIDYMVIGAVALMAHGYPRFTEDIDLVLTVEGLTKFERELLGTGGWGLSGYVRADPGSRANFRSVPAKISIKVRTTGEYPGDGQPKPVRMPEPKSASVEIDGVRFVSLDKLIELKLASGMTASDRLKDLADVQELIKIKELPADFAARLDPYVRDKFVELREAVIQAKKTDELE